MIKCEDCTVACDFCKHFDFNGDKTIEGYRIYTGDGWCRLKKIDTDPGDYCDNYHCKRVK
jgi:hypothetical protein